MRSIRVALCLSLCTGAFTADTARGAPDSWDTRLNLFCGLQLVDVRPQIPSGQGYWRLKEALFQPENESGGQHHIFVRAYDVNGQGIIDQKFFVSYPYNTLSVNEGTCVQTGNPGWTCAQTKGPGIDNYFGNIAMAGNCPPGACNGAYNAFISETSSPKGYIGKSDKVIGMWMHNPFGTGCNAHVNFRLTFQWTIVGEQLPPEIGLDKTSFGKNVELGNNLSADTFKVKNNGGGVLEYSITESLGWLSVSPNNGTSTGEEDTITINYNTAGLGAGTHQGTIQVSDPDATNSPVNIFMTVVVSTPAPPGDFDGDGDVDQSDFGRFQACIKGPGIIQDDPFCAGAKLDNDVDVDQDDFGVFQGCYSGPNIPADFNCAN